MSYVSEINHVARQILDELNEQDKKAVSENSTGKVERFLCPYCQNDVGVNDTECSECHRQLN